MSHDTGQGSIASKGPLVVGGSPADAGKVVEALAEDGAPCAAWAPSVSEALERLTRPGVTSILLHLPETGGLDAFDTVAAAAGQIPILVLCAVDDEPIGRLAVERGAGDFLLADHFDRYSLTRAVRALHERFAIDDALFDEKERAEVTLNSIGDAVLSTDIAGNVTYLNTVAETMTGWSRADAAGRPVREVFNIMDGVTGGPCPNPMELAVRENKTVTLTANCVLIRRDGYESPIEDSTAPIHDRRGRITGAVIVFHDVSAARQMSLQLSHLAQHDYLTDLPNRMLLSDRLRQAISVARRHKGQLAVLFLDLDRFKHVNDCLGHVVGDELLKEVALRLTHGVRGSDTVARQGGDEFIVVLSDVANPESAGTAAAKLLAALTAPYQIGLHSVRAPVSIGVSLYPDDARDAETLLKHADAAMYHAKENGRNNVQFFKQEMAVRAVERQFIEAGLRGAIDRHEFSLHYQPKIDLATHGVVGVEALLRWQHPERGFIPPAQFIPVAEDTGLILPIGLWVLGEACRQARAWLDAGLPAMPMAVNISAIEFRSQDFVENIRATLQQAGLDAHSLELEITESVLMKHAESTVAMLESLKRIGVQLTVDDFGTGYSSLSYLRQFPIDCLKVDRSFVREIAQESDGAVIVRAVISMGNSLNKHVVAEGVETREQLDFLIAAGCEEAQGYYFRQPMAADEFEMLLTMMSSVAIPPSIPQRGDRRHV
jgi:diguanylate cyclase (GGDEF)-like protein/PAS domain S-box-containing protein